MTPAATQQEAVYEHDGLLWKAKLGATSSFADLVQARTVFTEINEDARWNPWVRKERNTEIDQAMAVMEQWTRAEPDFRQMTAEEIDEMLTAWEREYEAKRAADEERWAVNKARFDADRVGARLALLEKESRLQYVRAELARFSESDPARSSGWAWRISELEDEECRLAPEVDQRRHLVGDPENVVDERGRLPSDRRKAMLLRFRFDREHDVETYREKLPELRIKLNEAADKSEQAKLRAQIAAAEQRLQELLAMSPLTEDDMCSECATPAAWHGWVTPPYDGPCPGWPGWAANVRRARQILIDAMERRAGEKQAAPSAPLKPLATLKSGLSIEEVIARLTEVKEAHPGAVVKRGRANRWEIWPTD